MSQLPSNSRALRQLVVVAVIAFFVGMAAVLALVGWLMWYSADPTTPWWEMLHTAINGLMISVVGGLALAAGATSVLSWWQYRIGMFRCACCGKPLRGFGIPCDCPERKALMAASSKARTV